jgi:hypothetical protein
MLQYSALGGAFGGRDEGLEVKKRMLYFATGPDGVGGKRFARRKAGRLQLYT